MGSSPFLVSAVGMDDSGSILTDHLKKLSVVLVLTTLGLSILRTLQEYKYWMVYQQPRSV